MYQLTLAELDEVAAGVAWQQIGIGIAIASLALGLADVGGGGAGMTH